MSNTSFDPALRARVEAQMERGHASKRAHDVAHIIFENGSCTTTDIESLGYKHAPRAVGDLRDAGIEVSKTMEQYVEQPSGAKKRRARYFISGTTDGKVSRHPFSRAFTQVVKVSGHCEVCGALPPLQIDHRVPFEIGGERFPHQAEDFMPLCPSCNRSKSWACEHCPNREVKDIAVCKACMWASPKGYKHVAMQQVREFRGTLYDLDDIRRYDEQRPDVPEVLSEYMQRVDEGTQEPLAEHLRDSSKQSDRIEHGR